MIPISVTPPRERQGVDSVHLDSEEEVDRCLLVRIYLIVGGSV